MVRVRSWEQHFVKEGSHKDRNTRKGVCVCVGHYDWLQSAWIFQR